MEMLSNIGIFLWYIHKKSFEMVLDFPTYCEDDGAGIAILIAFLGIVNILILLFLEFLVIYGIYTLFHWLAIVIRTKEIREKIVEGVVTEKEHEKEHYNVTYNVVFKMPMSTYTAEEYNVYVEYDGIEEVFDNKKLYKKTKKNKKIDLLLVERIDRRGRVIKRTLELPE